MWPNKIKFTSEIEWGVTIKKVSQSIVHSDILQKAIIDKKENIEWRIS